MSEALDCVELVELVTDYLEGTLDTATARRVAEHLEQCPGCAEYVDQIRDTVASLGSRTPSDDRVTPEIRASLLQAFGGAPGSRA